MSAPKKTVLRQPSKSGVENISLPSWDRDGNLINRPTKRPIKAKVEDVPERKVKVPTVKEIESIQETAYDEGFQRGFEKYQRFGKYLC